MDVHTQIFVRPANETTYDFMDTSFLYLPTYLPPTHTYIHEGDATASSKLNALKILLDVTFVPKL